jgi:hypothetical protein
METTPQIKASYFAGSIRGLDALQEQESEARKRHARLNKGFDGLSTRDWVPLAWDLECTHVVAELAGMAAVRATNKRAMLLSLEGALVGPFLRTSVAIFGLSPRTFIRTLPRVWAAASKDLGSLEVLLGEDGGCVAHVGLPPEVRDDPIWLEGFCGILEGILEATQCTGTVASPRVVNGDALYDLSWRRR